MRRSDLLNFASQQMAASGDVWQHARQQDFTGGENRLLAPDFVAPNQVILATNCEITPEGLLQTRKGMLAMNATSLGTGSITAAFRYKKESGSSYIVVQYGSSLYSANYDGGMTVGAFTQVKTGLTVGSKLRGVVWKDVLILTNGTEPPFTFNGTTCTDVPGTPPKSKLIAVYGAKLFLVPVTTPNIIQWSGNETYSTWDVLDVIKIRDGDGDKITGLAPIPGGLVITKSNSVWALYGTSLADMRLTTSPIADNVGCYASDTLLTQPQMFMGKDGFYSFDLSGVKRMTRTHDAILAAMTDAQKQAAFGCHLSKENRALIAFPDSNNTVLNFDLNFGCITSWDSLNANCLITADAAGDMQAFIVGDKTNGVLNMICDENTDNGVPIMTQIWTAYTDCGSLKDKVFRLFKPEFAAVNTLNASVVLYYDVDYSMLGGIGLISAVVNPPMEWNADNWDEKAWGKPPRIRDPLWIPSVRGYRVSCGVRVAGRVKLLGYILKFREIGDI